MQELSNIQPKTNFTTVPYSQQWEQQTRVLVSDSSLISSWETIPFKT